MLGVKPGPSDGISMFFLQWNLKETSPSSALPPSYTGEFLTRMTGKPTRNLISISSTLEVDTTLLPIRCTFRLTSTLCPGITTLVTLRELYNGHVIASGELMRKLSDSATITQSPTFTRTSRQSSCCTNQYRLQW